MKNYLYCTVFLFFVTLLSCMQKKDAPISTVSGATSGTRLAASPALAPYPTPPDFGTYWYQGKAEICTYNVEQERYGEKRIAQQVNVFVTEDFSKKKHVKLDDPANAGDDRVPVLKLNTIRRFKTGIYDYSIMQSAFTPVGGGKTLKLTSSIQDWCGQVFMQANLQSNSAYDLKGFSYFESESDSKITLANGLLEEEFWLKIRLGPDKIAQGSIGLIPSSVYSRLRHKPLKVEQAEVKIEKRDSESILSIKYTNLPRTLSIRFESVSPYRILGWEETYNGSIQSKGILKKSLLSPYWSQHSNADSGMRDSLDLNF
jgi:hypothetical protein